MRFGQYNLRRLLLLLLIPVPAILIGLQEPPPMGRGVRIVDVVAAVPEAGGFQPDSVTVQAGQRLRLRFRAADVAHGVAIGPGLGLDLGDLAPGAVKVVDVTFDQAGTFTFYCNKWCSPNHWRMRGVIDVQERGAAPLNPQTDPIIDSLIAEGIDIDAYLIGDQATDAHAAAPAAPAPPAGLVAGPLANAPSAAGGAGQIAALTVPEELNDPAWRRRHTPLDAESLLLVANPTADPMTVSNVTAYLWIGQVETGQLETAAVLYAKNCAACHGDSGDGRGFDAASAPQPPPSFADAQRMAGRRSDVLYAKIRRGGMGTGMPNFGTLFTPEETWSLVEYIWRLAYQ